MFYRLTARCALQVKQQEAKTDVNDCKVHSRFLGAAAPTGGSVLLQALHCFGQALTKSSFSPCLASMTLSRCFFDQGSEAPVCGGRFEAPTRVECCTVTKLGKVASANQPLWGVMWQGSSPIVFTETVSLRQGILFQFSISEKMRLKDIWFNQ